MSGGDADVAASAQERVLVTKTKHEASGHGFCGIDTSDFIKTHP